MSNTPTTVPDKLEDWSLEVIKMLLSTNQKENQFFDFKTSTTR